MDKNQLSSQVSTTNQARSVKSQNKSVIKKMEYGNNMCNYTHRICLQNKLEGCEHCIRHILYDKNAIFKQCSFVHPQSHKRCPNAARKADARKESVCPWHLKKIFLRRKQLQNMIEKKSITKTSATQQLFRDLEHYCSNQNHDKERLNSNWIKHYDDSIMASDHLRRKIVDPKSHVDNTDTDEDLNDPLVENTFRTDMIDSDSESIDSDYEEPLKHAGVYTAEEVSAILRDKMIRLQSLYVDELGYLQYLLKEKYKKYINKVRNQQDVFCPFKFLPNGNLPSDDYNNLKAMMRYHRYHGTEALLRMQLKEKRNQIPQKEQTNGFLNNSNLPTPLEASITTKSNSSIKPKTLPLCIYEKEGEKCDRRTMPLTHYCKIHILYDEDQVLFRPCAAGNPPCLNPVMSFQKANTCILHTDQKEIKDFHILEEDENLISKIDESSAPVSDFNVDDETGTLDAIETVDTTSLFGLDQFNQLESNQ